VVDGLVICHLGNDKRLQHCKVTYQQKTKKKGIAFSACSQAFLCKSVVQLINKIITSMKYEMSGRAGSLHFAIKLLR
jgi:hypothetical protein